MSYEIAIKRCFSQEADMPLVTSWCKNVDECVAELLYLAEHIEKHRLEKSFPPTERTL